MKKQAAIDFEKTQVKNTWTDFIPGDTISVSYRIEEGGKERIQIFQGVCIARRGEGMGESFTVRKLTQGYGVERTFPAQSPFVSAVKIEKRGRVRRAKLYYLRDRVGKATKVADKIYIKKEKVVASADAPVAQPEA